MRIINTIYQKYPVSLLLLLSGFLFLVNLEVLFVNIMEARNFITAREMLTHDNWIFTTMNQLPRYEKPPLPTWITAISAGIFGLENTFAYRLPAALTGMLLCVVFYKFQLKLNIHRSLAFLSSLILITSFYILYSSRDGQWDIFTHSFMVVSCYFVLLMLTSVNKRFIYALAAGLFFGASLLSKGPVSLYALFLPFLISFAAIYKFPGFKSTWKPWAVFIITGLLVGSWWSVMVHYFDAEAFTRSAAQESSRWFNYNVRPVWYYWSFFTQSGIWTIPALLSLFYWYMRPRVSNLRAYQFFLLWTVISLVLLSVIPEKKSRYLLPVLIPLAMTTGFYVQYVIRNFKLYFSRMESVPVYLNFGILALICFSSPFVLVYALGDGVFEMMIMYVLFSISMLLAGIAILYFLFKKQAKQLFAIQISMIFVLIAFGLPFVKLMDPERNVPNIEHLKELAQERDLQIYEYKYLLPEMIWKYGQAIPIVSHQDAEELQNREKFGILIQEEQNEDWQQHFRDYDIKFSGSYDLNPHNARGSNPRLTRNFYIAIKK